MASANAINVALIIFCILINIIIIFFIFINEFNKEKQTKIFIGVILINFVLLLSYLIGQFLYGNPNRAYNPVLTWSATIYQVSTQMLLLLQIKLTMVTIENKAIPSRLTMYSAYTAAAAVIINLLLSVTSPFTGLFFYYDENNHVVFREIFMISNVTTSIWTVITFTILMAHRKILGRKELYSLLSYVILPTLGLFLFILSGAEIQFIIFSITLSILIYFAGTQIDLSAQIKQKELELTQSRIAIMTSQIQPHFIYNALAAIKSLIKINPKLAEDTVAEFAHYLRSNINSLSITEPVSFETELKHVETYLSIEQKRFKDKLNITYDITVRDFCLPTLSIQPIVENAVRHGITSKRETGGNISISVHEINKEIKITITDDGAGFDTNQLSNNENQTSTGLKNVKIRLAVMVNGTLNIQSKPGHGTTVIITIPRGEK